MSLIYSIPIGQSRDQALRAIDNVLELEKSLLLLNENILSLESQLMSDFSGSDVPEELERLRAQHSRFVDSLCRKRAALGVDERAHLALLRQNNFLRIRMNARALKHRIRNRLRQRKFELEMLERAYRQTINGESKLRLYFRVIR